MRQSSAPTLQSFDIHIFWHNLDYNQSYLGVQFWYFHIFGNHNQSWSFCYSYIPNFLKFQPSFAISFNIHIFGNNLNYNLEHILLFSFTFSLHQALSCRPSSTVHTLSCWPSCFTYSPSWAYIVPSSPSHILAALSACLGSRKNISLHSCNYLSFVHVLGDVA